MRISGSGDGCGEHWPFCYGEVFPAYAEVKTLIENLHRLSTKIFGFLIIGLAFWVFKTTPKKHGARFWILVTLFFTLTEGLLGAILVLKGLVGENESPARAIVMGIHLINTFLLMAGLFMTWLRLGGHPDIHDKQPPFSVLRHGSILIGLWFLVSGFGALAALASTLFSSHSLLESMAKDFANDSHFSLRIRILHPFLAILTTTYLLWFWQQIKNKMHFKWAQWFQYLAIFHFFFGVVTLGTLSPIWMKLSHLGLTHIVWLTLIYSLAQIFRSDRALAQ